MKKTITANISGIVFHIDEDAYEKLNHYLSGVRSHFTSEEGGDEILTDIEGRIAEMLQEKITASKKVITLEDVNSLISQLGEPEQIGGTEDTEKTSQQQAPKNERAQKRLYRDPDDKFIAGVSGGIGAFFNIDPTWIRVVFVILTFLYAFGPLLYLILWIIVPKATTTAEKLEMRGEKVNISNIEKSIREELNELKENIKEFSEETKEKIKKKGKNKKWSGELSDSLAAIFAVMAKIVGIGIILFAMILLVAFISSIYWMPFSFHVGHGIFQIALPQLIAAILSPPLFVNITLVGLLLLIGIPILLILVAGIKLLFGIDNKIKYLGGFSFILWLIGLSIVTFMFFQGIRNFSAHQKITEHQTLTNSQWPNIYLQSDIRKVPPNRPGDNFQGMLSWKRLWLDTGKQAKGLPDLKIMESLDDSLSLFIIKESRGLDYINADNNAHNIQYRFAQTDSLITLDPYFYFDKNDGWRNQKVTLEMHVPKDKNLVVSEHFKRSMNMTRSRTINVIGYN